MPPQPTTIPSALLRPLADVRAETGFGWTCRRSSADDASTVTETHEIISGDRAEYERHMRGHGLKPVKSSYQQPKPWKPPRPATGHAPGPADPGQRIEWVSLTEAHWDGRQHDPATGALIREGTWIPETRQTRTGTIWSVADTPSAWWVQPDDDPAHPVYVKRAGKSWRDRAYGEGALYEIPGVAEAARANVLRGELVRNRGIFPVVDAVLSEHTGYHSYGSNKRVYVLWHSDPACPRAQDKDRYDRASSGAYGFRSDHDIPWTPLDVAQALANRRQPPSCLCPDCITGLDIGAAAAPGTTPANHPLHNSNDSHGEPGDDNTTGDAAGGGEAASSPGKSLPPADDPRRGDSASPAQPSSVPVAAACPARPGHILRLERPPTDTEFIDSCTLLAATLAQLAASVPGWTSQLAGLHFPAAVTSPLHQAADALAEAATSTQRAVTTFRDQYTAARSAAGRGLRFTGRDTA